LREMEEVNKDTGEVIFDHLHAAAFQGHSLGRTILGPEKNIRSITREHLVDYIKTHYHAPRMVLAAAGAIKHDEIAKLSEKAFAGLPSRTDENIDFFRKKEKPFFTGSQITVRDDLMEHAHIALAVEGVGWSHTDYYTFMVLQTIIGSWDKTIGGGKNLSSRMSELIATHNLADSFTCFNTCYSDTGLFGFYTVITPEGGEVEHCEPNVQQLMREALNEWNRIGRFVSSDEVERAKTKLKASVLMQMDGTTAICEDIGRQVLTHGRRLSAAEVFMRIDTITPDDVMRVVREHCEDVCPTVACVGQTLNMPDYNFTRGWTYWNRV